MPLDDVLAIEWAPADLPNDPSPTWQPLATIVESGWIERGRSGVFEQYGAGQMELDLIGNDTFTMAGWYKHRQIRARYIGDAANIPLFTGYIDDLEFDAHDLPTTCTMRLTAKDAGGLLSTAEHKGDTETLANTAELDGFPFVTRLADLINNAITDLLLPLTLDADTYATNAPINLPEQITGNMWQLIIDALEAEHGTLQVGGDGLLYLNGRYTPWLAFDPDAPLDATFSFADNGIDPAAGIYAPMRDDLTFARPGETYRNDVTAKSRWFDPPVHAGNVPTGYPPQSLSRTELLWIRQPWVVANAKLWANIHSDIQTFPQALKVQLWAGNKLLPLKALTADKLAPKVCAATVRLGTANVAVEVAVPGDTTHDFLVTPEAVRFEFDKQHFSATLGFTNRLAYDEIYGLDNGLFTLDGDADHGLDGTAILAP